MKDGKLSSGKKKKKPQSQYKLSIQVHILPNCKVSTSSHVGGGSRWADRNQAVEQNHSIAGPSIWVVYHITINIDSYVNSYEFVN